MPGNDEADLEVVRHCALCGSDKQTQVRRCAEPQGAQFIAEMRGDRVLPIARCNECGLVFVSRRYTEAKLQRLYGTPYFTASGDFEGNRRSALQELPGRARALRGEVALLARYAPNGGSLLDAGCGLGAFSLALGERWRVSGVDWSAFAVATAARCSRQERSIAANLDSWTPEPEQYDALSLVQTLDHLRNPLAVLRRLVSGLKPGGTVLMAGVINFNSPMSFLFKNAYRLLSPNHLYYFTPRTMRNLLRRAGLELRAMEYPFFGTPFFKMRWCVDAPVAVLRHLCGGKALSPPGPGNVMNVIAVKTKKD